MKKRLLLAAVLTLVLSFALCACGKASPTETADSFLQAVKAQDTEALAELYAGEDMNVINEVDDYSDSEALYEMYNDKLLPKILDFDYELANEQINEETATVDVTITTYEIGDAFSNFVDDFMQKALDGEIDINASDEEIAEIQAKMLSNEFDKMKKEYTKTVTLSMTQKDGVWIIDELQDEGDFYNAMTGGMMEAVDDM